MKNELLEYIRQAKELAENGEVTEEKLYSMLVNIKFFQHERLVHLLVTLAFAIMTIITLAMVLITVQIPLIILFLLFLALTVPYVFHYYRLENGVQELQRTYRKAEERLKK